MAAADPGINRGAANVDDLVVFALEVTVTIGIDELRRVVAWVTPAVAHETLGILGAERRAMKRYLGSQRGQRGSTREAIGGLGREHGADEVSKRDQGRLELIGIDGHVR